MEEKRAGRTVSTCYEGLWRRKAIYRSNGSVDTTTAVWWFQSSSYHIDLRIPVDGRPEKKSGFAGVTYLEVDADTMKDKLEWIPDIAFPLVNHAEVDAGYMTFIEKINNEDGTVHEILHEKGVCGSYEEDWYREQGETILDCRREEQEDGRVSFTIETEHWKAVAKGKGTDNYYLNEDSPKEWCDISVFHREDDGAWKIVASTII